jgi:transposase
MPRPRRFFPPEYKAEVVELIRSTGKTVGQVSKDLDLTETAVRQWVRQADLDTGRRSDGLTTAEREDADRSWCGDQQRLELVDGRGPGLDGASAGGANTRIASMIPSRRLGAAVALPASTARAAASASIGSDLPRWRPVRRSGRSTSTTRTCWSPR